MQPIELEKYKPSPDDPCKLEYTGQRTGREVFAELKQRLENLGLLPDEYFLIGREWEHGEDIPKDADLFVTTDYGGSEGIYLRTTSPSQKASQQVKRLTKPARISTGCS